MVITPFIILVVLALIFACMSFLWPHMLQIAVILLAIAVGFVPR